MPLVPTILLAREGVGRPSARPVHALVVSSAGRKAPARFEAFSLNPRSSHATPRLRASTAWPRPPLPESIGQVPDPYGTGLIDRWRSEDGRATALVVWSANPLRRTAVIFGGQLVASQWMYGPGARRIAFTDLDRGRIRTRIFDTGGRKLYEGRGVSRVVTHPKRTGFLTLSAHGEREITAEEHERSGKGRRISLTRAVRSWIVRDGRASDVDLLFERVVPYGFLDRWFFPDRRDSDEADLGDLRVMDELVLGAHRSLGRKRFESGRHLFAVTPNGDVVVTGHGLLEEKRKGAPPFTPQMAPLEAIAWNEHGVRSWSVTLPEREPARGFLLVK